MFGYDPSGSRHVWVARKKKGGGSPRLAQHRNLNRLENVLLAPPSLFRRSFFSRLPVPTTATFSARARGLSRVDIATDAVVIAGRRGCNGVYARRRSSEGERGE